MEEDGGRILFSNRPALDCSIPFACINSRTESSLEENGPHFIHPKGERALTFDFIPCHILHSNFI